MSGDAAFKATLGKTISEVKSSTNSIEIHFSDKSFINIEFRPEPGSGCSGHGSDEYCYCSPPEVEVESYFHP